MLENLCDGRWVSEIFDLPGFRFEHISIDAMHCIDLGVAQYCLGNILYELFRTLGGQMKKADPALSKLMVMFKLAAKSLGGKKAPIGSLTIGMIKPDGRPPRFKVTPL